MALTCHICCMPWCVTSCHEEMESWLSMGRIWHGPHVYIQNRGVPNSLVGSIKYTFLVCLSKFCMVNLWIREVGNSFTCTTVILKVEEATYVKLTKLHNNSDNNPYLYDNHPWFIWGRSSRQYISLLHLKVSDVLSGIKSSSQLEVRWLTTLCGCASSCAM